MRTSADIYFKAAIGRKALAAGVCGLALLFVSACATTKSIAPTAAPVKGSVSEGPYGPATEFQEFKGEKKSCVASWYGREFHGKPTASGENFNMFALTCAHRDYPLGTKVRVTNPSNGLEVECTVNDRGPLVGGRDIDLSYAAARKIGLIGPGVARVEVEPLGRYTRYVRDVRYSQLDNSPVTIQIGSFREEANARRLKRGLELHYKDIYIIQTYIGKERYHRVRVGKFKDSSEALKLAATLAREGYNVLITRYEGQI